MAPVTRILFSLREIKGYQGQSPWLVTFRRKIHSANMLDSVAGHRGNCTSGRFYLRRRGALARRTASNKKPLCLKKFLGGPVDERPRISLIYENET
jgi:hypothetical protein